MGAYAVGVKIDPDVARAICHPEPVSAQAIERWVQYLVEEYSPAPHHSPSVPAPEPPPAPSADTSPAAEDAGDGEPGGLSDA